MYIVGEALMANETKRLPTTRRSLLLLPLFFLSSCAHTQEQGSSFPNLLQHILITVEKHHLQARAIDHERFVTLSIHFLDRIDHLPTCKATRDTSSFLPALWREYLSRERTQGPTACALLMPPERIIRDTEHWHTQLSTDPKLSDCYPIMSTLLHDRT